MSAADEYRLLALTLPMREIVKDLNVPEDVRCVLIWLEERGYGDVAEHVDDAMAMGYQHNGKRVFPLVRVRFEWLLHYVSLTGPKDVEWPSREGEQMKWLTEEALAQALPSADTYSYAREIVEHAPRRLVRKAWVHMLEVVGERARVRVAFNEDPRDSAARSVWNVFEALNKLHKHGYPIFVSGFFRQFAFAGHTDVVLAGRLQPPPGTTTKELRWKV